MNVKDELKVFRQLESDVRSYSRSFPTKFHKASGYQLWNSEGKSYIDFFSGAGALNYGHNHPNMRAKLIEYLMDDGVIHSLDMATEAKERFLTKFHEIILKPRNMDYKVMFPGPTGTNSVESALKLVRKATGRQTVMCFTNAFHGMTLGALAVTGNKFKRGGAGVSLGDSVFMPYDGYMGKNLNTLEYIENFLKDSGSGISLPAAVIVETLQGEGGINVASTEWLIGLEKLCKKYGMLFIVDDVQMGCGRTGPFFSFERGNLSPDIICMSKSIGGYGLPMAITLLKPELDLFGPGEHNGTFRGNNAAFITAAEALNFWKTPQFSAEIATKSALVHHKLEDMIHQFPELKGERRGIGLMQGIAFEPGIAERISMLAFERGLILETSGTDSEVIKLMPPLTIDEKGLNAGLHLINECLTEITSELKEPVAQR